MYRMCVQETIHIDDMWPYWKCSLGNFRPKTRNKGNFEIYIAQEANVTLTELNLIANLLLTALYLETAQIFSSHHFTSLSSLSNIYEKQGISKLFLMIFVKTSPCYIPYFSFNIFVQLYLYYFSGCRLRLITTVAALLLLVEHWIVPWVGRTFLRVNLSRVVCCLSLIFGKSCGVSS